VVLTQTTSLLNHLKPLLCYVMLFQQDISSTMTVDEISVDEMYVDEMSVDEVS